MLTRDFHFDLPQALIAQQPLPTRSDSRLLLCDAVQERLSDQQFGDIVSILNPGDLLVFNDTRVIPARFYGWKKATGGKLEVLIERVLSNGQVLCHISASKSPKAGAELCLGGGLEATVLRREGELFVLALAIEGDVHAALEQHGVVPLPPYIERTAKAQDKQRYQTIYARRPGAVAAPTAGLHFDRALLKALKRRGIQSAFITLHVGAGTFQPVRADNPQNHVMHKEHIEVGAVACQQIDAARARGNKVVAVGTTVVRSLETAAQSGILKPYMGDTDIFIRPGYRFRCVDALVTNFHLPKSTLLMLVSALGGYLLIMRAYRHAVSSGYRFFSYGDAMLIYPSSQSSSP